MPRYWPTTGPVTEAPSPPASPFGLPKILRLTPPRAPVTTSATPSTFPRPPGDTAAAPAAPLAMVRRGADGARPPAEAPAAAPEGCAAESHEARAARHGLVILPSGACVDVDQADEQPCPPALARFDVRTDPETDPEEHRRQALRADIAAYMANWHPSTPPNDPRT